MTMRRSLDRQRWLIFYAVVVLLPLLLHLHTFLKLTTQATEDHTDIDQPSNHDIEARPASNDIDATSSVGLAGVMTDIDQPFNPSNHVVNDRSYIKCSATDRKTKTETVTDVTPEDFYAEGSKCWHSFREDTVAFHVGKGGGGTLQKQLGIGVQWVHPYPRSSINKQLQSGPLKTLIVNVRDPIDRFVSAFNWRNAILCHPNDERHVGKKLLMRGKKVGATKNPNDFCKDGYEEEEILLRETYQSSPSVIAEALCRDSPLRPRAKKDFGEIHHSTTLTEWLDFLDPRLVENITDDGGGIQQLIVLPVEKRSGANETMFETHIENARLHLLQHRYDADVGKEMMILAQEQELKKEETRRLKMKGKPKAETHLHSSAKFYNSTKPTLTPLGECCLARFLTDDYRLIQSMVGGATTGNRDLTIVGLDPLDGAGAHPVIQKACSWGDEKQQQLCRGDLLSMLMRRAKYFDVDATCQAIVSSE